MGVTQESELGLCWGLSKACAPDGLECISEAILSVLSQWALAIQEGKEHGFTSFGSRKRENTHAGEIWSFSGFQDTVGLEDFPGRELD